MAGAASSTTAPPAQRRPLDAYIFSFQENVTIRSALQILEERCMAKYGFVLREAGAPHRPADTIRPNPEGTEMFGIPDPSQGYAKVATPAQLAADQRAEENGRYFATLPPMSAAYALAFGGRFKRQDPEAPKSLGEQIGSVDVYPTGCEGWAWDQIAPGDTSEGVFPLGREIDPWEAAAADQRVGDANTVWSECMKAAGYSYTGPDDIKEEDRRRGMALSDGRPHFEEDRQQEQYMKTVAPIDDGCRTSSGYAQIRFDVLSEYDRRVIDQHATELAERRATMDDEVRRAAEVVKEAGW